MPSWTWAIALTEPAKKALSCFLYWFAENSSLIQRALEPKGAQLALGDAAQAVDLAERHEILRAGEQRFGDVGLLRGVADDDERYGDRRLLLDLGDLADRCGQAVGEEAQQLRARGRPWHRPAHRPS